MKILFFAISNSSFIEKDFNILRSEHDVTKVAPELLKLYNIKKLYNLIKNNDSVFFWFASLQFFTSSIISWVLKKKIYVVAGGYDVASVTEIDYGSCSVPHKKIIIRTILNLATKIFAVSNSNQKEIIVNCGIDGSKIKMIYHGFEDVPIIDFEKKTDKILTIAVINEISYLRKGIDNFLRLAQMMPKIEFILIGSHNDFINNKIIPRNVRLTGFLEKEKFIENLTSAKIYVQLSIHEGFGCSVAEAMQYGCVPVVSNNYSLPEVVGECGTIVERNESINKIASRIQSILKDYNPDIGNKCIDRIRKEFSLEKRRELLLKYIDNN